LQTSIWYSRACGCSRSGDEEVLVEGLVGIKWPSCDAAAKGAAILVSFQWVAASAFILISLYCVLAVTNRSISRKRKKAWKRFNRPSSRGTGRFFQSEGQNSLTQSREGAKEQGVLLCALASLRETLQSRARVTGLFRWVPGCGEDGIFHFNFLSEGETASWREK
jgi:hypothetical protein